MPHVRLASTRLTVGGGKGDVPETGPFHEEIDHTRKAAWVVIRLSTRSARPP